METTRRSFLKLLAVAGAASAAPSVFSMVDAEALTPDNQRLVGMIRETKRFDITRNQWVVRYDIRTADIHIGVDGLVGDLSQISHVREPALTLLSAELEHRGLTARDLLELPAANF